MIQFGEHIFQMGWFNHQLDDVERFWLLILLHFFQELHGQLPRLLSKDELPTEEANPMGESANRSAGEYYLFKTRGNVYNLELPPTH